MASKVIVSLKPDLQTPILSSADFMRLPEKTQAKFGFNAMTSPDLKKIGKLFTDFGPIWPDFDFGPIFACFSLET